jgi:hypothetical protein
MALIDHRRRTFSQNGEDGIIARVFECIGPGNRLCCEFGAGDGIQLSNTRALILDGWSALLIEAEEERARALKANYAGNDNVVCEHSLIDTAANTLSRVIERSGFAQRRLDLLSIDIDGSDFEIFSTLEQLGPLPRLVMVEVQPEHGPYRSALVPPRFACENVGQPLAAFVSKGKEVGYRLISYLWCNAFFLAEDVGCEDQLPTVTAEQAWFESMELIKRSSPDAEHIYLRNLGLAGPTYRFSNRQLTAEWLGIDPARAKRLVRERASLWKRIRLGTMMQFSRP